MRRTWIVGGCAILSLTLLVGCSSDGGPQVDTASPGQAADPATTAPNPSSPSPDDSVEEPLPAGLQEFTKILDSSIQAAADEGVVEDYRDDCPLARNWPSPGEREWTEIYKPNPSGDLLGVAKGEYRTILFPIKARTGETSYRGSLRDLEWLPQSDYTIVENTASAWVFENEFPEGLSRFTIGVEEGLITETTNQFSGTSEFLGKIDCARYTRIQYSPSASDLELIMMVDSAITKSYQSDGKPTPEHQDRVQTYLAGVEEGQERACETLRKRFPDRYPPVPGDASADPCSDFIVAYLEDIEDRFTKTTPVTGTLTDIKEYGRWRGWYNITSRHGSCSNLEEREEFELCIESRLLPSPFIGFPDLKEVGVDLNPSP